jgi:glycosyltransferase involved in cell wall biosynthesis
MVDVSVVIPTWNNAGRLAVTLETLASCRIPHRLRWELIVVANNCTDHSRAVVSQFTNRVPVVYVEEPRQGASHARNAGVAMAVGELLVFADDDVRPGPDWIDRYWSAYRAMGDRYYFGGPLRSEFEGGETPDRDLLRAANRSVAGMDYGPHDRQLGPGEEFLEANWACPLNAVRAAGGYDPRLGLNASLDRRRVGEGMELMERLNQLGMTPYYLSEACVHHFVPQSNCNLYSVGAAFRAQGIYASRRSAPAFYMNKLPWLKSWRRNGGWSAAAGLRLAGMAGWAWGTWCRARVSGRKGYEEYLSLQFCLGLIEGNFRDTASEVGRPIRAGLRWLLGCRSGGDGAASPLTPGRPSERQPPQ